MNPRNFGVYSFSKRLNNDNPGPPAPYVLYGWLWVFGIKGSGTCIGGATRHLWRASSFSCTLSEPSKNKHSNTSHGGLLNLCTLSENPYDGNNLLCGDAGLRLDNPEQSRKNTMAQALYPVS